MLRLFNASSYKLISFADVWITILLYSMLVHILELGLLVHGLHHR